MSVLYMVETGVHSFSLIMAVCWLVFVYGGDGGVGVGVHSKLTFLWKCVSVS